MPAFSLEWRPQLDHSAASLATRRSPTHPRTWTLKALVAAVRTEVAETTTVKTAIHLNHKGPGYHANVTASAVCLSPAKLSAQNHLTSELLRTLLRVAASKPTSWLFMQIHSVFHLACTLRPRATFWVVPLSHVELIPHELTAH